MPLFGELFLSEMLKKPVYDPTGNVAGTVRDFVIVKGDPLPRIAAIVVASRKAQRVVSWEQINIFNRRIISSFLDEMSMPVYATADDDLLAVRDILDKQILDVNGAKVVRVNDIKVEGYGTDAVLTAVDVGARGLLRRLGVEDHVERIYRVFQAKVPSNLISWNFIETLRPKLKSITLTIPGQKVSELHPADIAEIISQVSREEGAHLFSNLDIETAAETLGEMQPEMQAQIIETIDTEKVADIIEEMPPDEAADVLGDLPTEKAMEILEHIEKDEAEDIHELLSHEDDSAGGLMTNEFVAYPPEITVGEAIARFRTDAANVEPVFYVYVVDAAEKLLGVVGLRDMLMADPSRTLGDVMETKVKTVTPETDDFDVAIITAKYNLAAVPVVDDDGVLTGIVTVDDIIDMILPPAAKKKRGLS